MKLDLPGLPGFSGPPRLPSLPNLPGPAPLQDIEAPRPNLPLPGGQSPGAGPDFLPPGLARQLGQGPQPGAPPVPVPGGPPVATPAPAAHGAPAIPSPAAIVHGGPLAPSPVPAAPAGPAMPAAPTGFLPQVAAAVASTVRAVVGAMQPQAAAPAGVPAQVPVASPAPGQAAVPAAAVATPAAVPGQAAVAGAAPLQQGVPAPGSATVHPGQAAGATAAGTPPAPAAQATPAGATHAGAMRADVQVAVPPRADAATPQPREATLLDRLAALLRPSAAAPAVAPGAAAPAGTTAAQASAVALPLLAVPASQAPLDARGVSLLAVNDRAGVQRADAAMTGVYTAEGPGRRRLRRGANVLGGRMSDLLYGLRGGAAGHAGDDAAEVERLIANTMQWLFWVLAVVAYACLGLSIIAFLPVGSEVIGGSNRQWTGGFALGGLLAAGVAWLVARRLGAPR